jgi:hypothetical protein
MYRLILRPLSTAPELQSQGTSWQDLNLQGGWISEPGWFNIANQVRRINNLVELKIAVSNPSAEFGSVICTLSSEFRPSDRCVLTGLSLGTSGTAAGIISVIPNGEVRLNQSVGVLVLRQTFWKT